MRRLEEQVRVSIVEGQIANLVDDEQALLRVMPKASIERSRGVLRREVEQELRGGNDEDGVPCQNRFAGDVLGDHRFAKPLWSNEDDVACFGEEFES